LDAVSAKLKEIETDLQSTNETIASFCSELNIPTPF
jgi:type I restriction enzyme M protein